jgi:diguanylate cyclase (GGDEF)-like protein/PAS domain S-box-containing protein
MPRLPALLHGIRVKLRRSFNNHIAVTQLPPDINARSWTTGRLLPYLIAGLGALLVVTFFAVTFFTLAKSRDARLEEAGRTTRDLSQIVEQRAAHAIQAVDLTLRGVSLAWQQNQALRNPATGGMHALLAQKLAELPHARTLFTLDARGLLAQDSDLQAMVGKDFSDREYFNWHRSHAGELYVGKPAVRRTGADWFLVASRRLDDADGRFAGVVGVALEPAAFRSLFENVEIGHDGVAAILHADGELIASYPEAPTWLGIPTGGNLTLKDLAAGPLNRRSVSAVDGVARIYGMRAVAGEPMIVQVGLSEEDVLAGWRTEKKFTITILIGLTLATIILTWLLAHELRRRNQRARTVAQSEQMLRQVLDTLPVGVWVADRDGNLVLGNAASKYIWGESPQSGMQRLAALRGWQAGGDVPSGAQDAGLARALTTGKSSRNELMDVECFDGSRKTILYSAAPIIAANGEIVGGVAVNEDITDRRELAETLRESEARYRALFEHAIDAVFLMQPDGGIVSANAQACKLLGYSEEELQLLGPEGLTAPGDPRVANLLAEHNREGRTQGELTLRRKDGSWVPVEVSSTTFHDRSGELCTSLIMRDVTDRKRAEEHIEYLAYHDELTGIPNRAHFQRSFEHTIAISQRQGLKSALMVIDLDRFKNINDIIGHEAGDQLLKQVAARLRTCLRDSDVLARLGGDEFVILMQDASSVEAVNAVAEKILEVTAVPLLIDGQEFQITASIGISMSPHDGSDLKTLLRNSDVAMYRVKASGKNSFQYFSPDMDLHGRERLSIEIALGRALERSEFELEFQPKMLVSSRHIVGMEALVRWRNPERGFMPPADFIAIAEETGMIVSIGDWVLMEACRHGQSLRRAGHLNLSVAVNLSVRQLYDEGLAGRVGDALRESGFPAENLELEITESMVMHDAEQAIKVLKSLRDTGVRIAIDDFGTGYSSLAYLKRFPIDSLKIDRSFIRDLPNDRDDASITRSIIAMAHNMKLEVVAEGVETVPQLEFLDEHGCDEIQGFLYSEPLGAVAFERFLNVQNERHAAGTLH